MLRYGYLALVFLIAGCGITPEKMENLANRSMTGWALGKEYSSVAALGSSPLERLSGEQSGYGPMIGQTQLADGTTLYRHLAPASERVSTASFGGLVGSKNEVQNYRLSYFKVGQDGIVKDWATGSVAGTVSDCMSYIGGIIQRCTDQGRVRQSLAVYDASVRTSSNTTLDAWGAATTAAAVQ